MREPIRAHIRWMIRRDMPEVLNIENAAFEFPWDEGDFIYCLRQRNCIGKIAEHEDQVLGYILYELHKSRIHILNMAVDPLSRRLGIGMQFVRDLQGKLSPQRRRRLTTNVRETNLPAQLFFRRCGLRAVRIVSGLWDKADSIEDAYFMECGFAERWPVGGRFSESESKSPR